LARACGLAVFVCVLGSPAHGGGRQSQPPPRHPLTAYLDSVARAHLKERELQVSKIQTREGAERRRASVRATALRLMGGLPAPPESVRRAPAVRRFGALEEEGFRVEKIAYESLPGFLVTANVYVPAAGVRGPFPAVLLTPGHDPRGKVGQYSWGANLARAGFVALAYDPISEGERFQNYDPELGASKVGGVTGEHGHADLQTLLLGEHVSRYFVWDAVRGLDYLAGRPDVDAARLGAFGCSGGGTVTAYLAALDERVKAAATACYITSAEELLASPAGPQEAEQSLPRFIERGLDFGDWVEAAAPRPYAIVSTTEDMFPFAGARRTYEEAKRVYGLYGAADRLQWITGPGGHGALNPVAPDILSFFARWLKGEDGRQTFTPTRPRRPDDLLCTPTGQLSDSVGGETVYSLNRKRAAELLPPRRALGTRAELARLQARLREEVRATAAISARPGASPPDVRTAGTTRRDGYRLEAVTMRAGDGLDLGGLLAVPDREGPKRAMLFMDSRPAEASAAAGGEVERLARAGWLVFVLQPRATPAWVDEIKSPLLGPHYLLSLRARLVGKTIAGMRADDIIRAVDWLAARPEVGRAGVAAYGSGPHGVALLHAAALDERIGRVFVENTLAAYRMAVERPLHRNLSEVALPGVLRRYDVGDLLLAASPRPVVFVNPLNSVGAAMREPEARRELSYVLDSERNLGTPGRVRLVWRGSGEPLPVE
jgi:cephalosporin-C deacetylase-like acetyl esterase